MSIMHKLSWCSHRYWPRFLVVLLSCSLLCSLHHHTRDTLRKGTLRIKGTVNRAQVVKKSYKKCRLIRMLARVDAAGWKMKISWAENFVTPGLTTKIMKISTSRK